LRLYEFEAKQLFSQFKIPITSGQVVETKEQTKALAEKIKKPVVPGQKNSGG